MTHMKHPFQNCEPFQKRLNMTQNEHVYAICYRPEVAGDAISRRTVEIIEGLWSAKFQVASSSSFRYFPKR